VLRGREREYLSSLDVLTVKLMGASSVELTSTSALLEVMVAGLNGPGYSPMKFYEFMCSTRSLTDWAHGPICSDMILQVKSPAQGELCWCWC